MKLFVVLCGPHRCIMQIDENICEEAKESFVYLDEHVL